MTLNHEAWNLLHELGRVWPSSTDVFVPEVVAAAALVEAGLATRWASCYRHKPQYLLATHRGLRFLERNLGPDPLDPRGLTTPR